jgi:hypothetical protein
VTDEHHQLRVAREAAHQAQRAAAELATFTERLSPVPDPATRAEYAALLARDEETRLDRQNALARLGLDIPSLDE